MTRIKKDSTLVGDGESEELESDGAHLLRVVADASVTVEVEAYSSQADTWFSFYNQDGSDHEIDPATGRVRVTVTGGDAHAVTYTRRMRQ